MVTKKLYYVVGSIISFNVFVNNNKKPENRMFYF